MPGSNSIIRFADDTTSLISNNNDTSKEEVQHLATWCTDNNLLFNTNRSNELTVDFRNETRGPHDLIQVSGVAVKPVSSYKFLGRACPVLEGSPAPFLLKKTENMLQGLPPTDDIQGNAVCIL